MKIFNRNPKKNTTVIYISNEIDGDSRLTEVEIVGEEINEETARYIIENLWEKANIKRIHIEPNH